ncbi:ParB/RepB/Spo0J family partition protein [Paenibacillus thermoaerophilus]|uniref:ParB/RepB/Spo0J family partition protein n=1 Tax=Paenibacillus thermoaerophilus TaxID=1215385 RepID=A0ABW2V1A9_9BACL|nr:ParB/RepB/Spo0J family partition protein [Paenibacillus thermoaerophilus]TMV18455.1 ParB/RepB/Spo0J family partition protein [Paenibacillus thermoaerophilus]
MEIIELPLALIDEDKDQPRYRFDDDSLQELTNSIAELGLLSPIKVRTASGGRYKIVYGNRRYKACKALGRETIPAIVSAATDEIEIYLEQIAENLTREGFTPIEEAEAFDKLLNDPKFSSSTKYLSGRLGKPESYIKNKLELLKFGPAVRKLVARGTEIRKDRLTEDQLLPLKDLPMEFRDPLALIMARDEMPVSDVKKIARLFKDKDLSPATKNKLLYKTGPELLETWSVFEQNRAARAKSAEPKPKAGEAEKRGTPPQEETAATAGTPIESRLKRLIAALPAPTGLPDDIARSVGDIAASDRASFLNDVDRVIDRLERHLAEWKQIREQAGAALASAAPNPDGT